MHVAMRGVLTGTIIHWAVEPGQLDEASVWRAVVDVVLPHVSRDLRTVLRALMAGPEDAEARVDTLARILAALRHEASPLLRQRVDVVLLLARQERGRARKDLVWVVTPSGRDAIGCLEWSLVDACWYGELFATGERIGPHEAEDSLTLVERMVRRAAGVADTWVTPLRRVGGG